MAENEYLDVGRARRWHTVVDALRKDLSSGEVFRRVLQCFYRTLQHVRRDLPLSDWLEAVGNPTKLATLVNASWGGDDVKGLLLSAAREVGEGGVKVVVMGEFLQGMLDSILENIPHMATESNCGKNMSEIRRELRDTKDQMLPYIQDLAVKFAENSSYLPKVPRGMSSTEQEPGERTVKMLGQSLLAGSGRIAG